MAGFNPLFTIANTINDYGVTDSALFNGDTKAGRMADKLFDDDFLSSMDKTYEEFDKDLK